MDATDAAIVVLEFVEKTTDDDVDDDEKYAVVLKVDSVVVTAVVASAPVPAVVAVHAQRDELPAAGKGRRERARQRRRGVVMDAAVLLKMAVVGLLTWVWRGAAMHSTTRWVAAVAIDARRPVRWVRRKFVAFGCP